MSSSSPQVIRLKDYSQPNFWLRTISLTITLDPQRTLVHAQAHFVHNPGHPRDLELHGCDLELLSFKQDGVDRDLTTLDYSPQHLRLKELPSSFTLELETAVYPSKNKALEGIYLSQGKFYTQCEPEGFRRITYFLDRPDVLTEFKTKLIASRTTYPVLLSNGNLIESGEINAELHYAVWHDPFPKPAYLFALVAGRLENIRDSYTTRSGRKVEIEIYVEAENVHKCGFAMDAIKHAMKWDEAVYDLEYDLDRFMVVAVSDFNMGAMENKGLNIFNAKYVLASPETATDKDFENILGIVGHEYFHNWTGNRVTLRDWFQLCLKEGLTVFRDQEFSSDLGSAATKRIQEIKILKEQQFAEDSGPMSHPVRPDQYIEINNFYTSTVYRKGAELIRMLQTILGKSAFLDGVKAFLRKYDGQAVTVEDFLSVMSERSGKDLEQFRLWYEQAGTPHVKITRRYDAEQKCLFLDTEQTLLHPAYPLPKPPQLIPLAVALFSHSGTPLVTLYEGKLQDEHLLLMTQKRQTFTFHDVSTDPIPSLLRSFSAPIVLKQTLSKDERYVLLAHDRDPYVRYESAQSLAIETIQAHAAGHLKSLDFKLIGAYESLLSDRFSDQRLIALAMQVPSTDYVLQTAPELSMESIFASRHWYMRELATQLYDMIWERYHALNLQEPYSLDQEAIGRRELKNTCLQLLCSLDSDFTIGLAYQQATTSHNMTDNVAALIAMASSSKPQRELSLNSFYERWQHDPLVIDKWFAIQSCSSHPDILQHVRQLLQHRDFTIANPNRVYSVFRQFTQCHPQGFHHLSGIGYSIVADYVIKIDSQNPQVAAMLAGSLSRFRNFDAQRQVLMSSELKRIQSQPQISNDVYEILKKSLNEKMMA